MLRHERLGILQKELDHKGKRERERGRRGRGLEEDSLSSYDLRAVSLEGPQGVPIRHSLAIEI